MKTIIKGILLLDRLLMYVLKNECQAPLPFFLTWVSLAVFFLDQYQMKLSVQLSTIVIVRRDNSLAHKLSVMAAVELHVNATYYAQHSAHKSLYRKSQSVIAGKLFSSYMTVFELAQVLQDSKTSDFSCSYKRHWSRKKHWPCVKIGYLHYFLCCITIISFKRVQTSVLWYWLTKEDHLAWEV